MMIDKFLRVAAPLFAAATAVAQNSEKPNIIFFLADDMGWQDTSLPFWTQTTPQNNRYRTPNMERLAQQGVMFTNAYSCPVSSPSRCSLISGMNAARHGVTNWIEGYNQNTNASGSSVTLPEWNWNGVQPAATCTSGDRLHSALITPLPQLLRDAGYLTIHCGKGNFGAQNTSASNPLNLGFDVNIAGGYAGGPGTYLAQDNYGSAIQAIGGLEDYAAQGIFLTEALTQEAIKNLNKAVEGDKPFYLYMSHYAIHTPYDADTRFTGNYTGYYDELIGATLNTSEVNRAALIEGMDKSLGDLMNWLKARPEVAKNTIILFMSDNGGQGVSPRQGRLNHDPNYPSRGGKGSGYDGGVHEPMIVSWPGVTTANTKNENRVMIEDFFPTILEMAGVNEYQTVQSVDGKSFTDILKDPSLTRDRTVIWHYPNRWGESADKSEGYGAWSAIMKGDYHLLYFWENQELRLYNIREDIGEENNLVSVMPELTKQMAQELTDSLKSYGARRPTLAGGAYVPWPVDGVFQASAGDVIDVNTMGIELSTLEGEKHLYTVQDARNNSEDEGGPFYWTLGNHNGYPAVQVTIDKLSGDDAVKQQFFFTEGSDSRHLCIYTADGKPVSYTEGITRSSYSGTDQVTAEYLQYGAEEKATEFEVVMTPYSKYYSITIDGLYISNRGTSHGSANNMGWTVMPYSGSSYADRGCRYKFVSIDGETDEPEVNDGPLTLTTDVSKPVYYRIRNTRCTAKGKANYALLSSESAKLQLTSDAEAATQFYFTGNIADGLATVKIHASGTENLMAGEASWSASGCDWYIKKHDSDQGGTDATTGQVYTGVLISKETGFSNAWYVGSSDTSIKLYASVWDGSIFTLEPVDVEQSDEELLNAHIATAKTKLQTALSTARNYENFILPGVLNCYHQGEGDEDFATLMKEAEDYLGNGPANSEEVLEKLNGYVDRLNAVLNNLSINLPEENTFIRMRSAKTLGYVRSHDTRAAGTDMECMSLSTEPDDYGIFYFDGTYLINYMEGLYVETNWLKGADDVHSKMTFKASADGTLGAYYIVADGSKGVRNLMVKSTSKDVLYRSNTNNDYNNFWVEYVTSLPVTITAARYATLYSPVPLAIPAGVTAYAAEDKGETVHLTPIEGVIPAHTGVVLYADIAEPTTFNFKVATGGSVSSVLTGTIATISYPSGAYILSDGTQGIAFYADGGETIPGFKAYLAAGSGDAVKTIVFDDPTAIHAVDVLGASGKVFDVSGRRVENPLRGLYIMDGRKVIIK